MLSDMIHPVSSVSARDILHGLLPDETATMDEAVQLADELRKDRGLFVDPRFLLEVWMEKKKEDAE